MTSPKEPTPAALEAALRYAQDKCKSLVSSASAQDPSDLLLTSSITPKQPSANSLLAPSTITTATTGTVPTSSKSRANSTTSPNDESDMEDDPSDDFGIDKSIAQAALAALGSDGASLAIRKNGKRPKKPLSEMDPDERLLASGEAKKLTSRQRRQIRNRVSARQFRLRRKEYISHLESLVVNMTTKINRLEQSVMSSKKENEMLSLALAHTTNQASGNQGQALLQSQMQQTASVGVPHRRQVSLPTTDFSQFVSQQHSQQGNSISHQSVAKFMSHQQQHQPQMFLGTPSPDEMANNLFDNFASPGTSPSSSSNSSSWSQSNVSVKQQQQQQQHAYAHEIRMSPNIVNLLPQYPDMASSFTDFETAHQPATASSHSHTHSVPTAVLGESLEWAKDLDFANILTESNNNHHQPNHTSMSSTQGYMHIRNNAQIYHSIVPDLAQQVKATSTSTTTTSDNDAPSSPPAQKDRKLKSKRQSSHDSTSSSSDPAADSALSRLAADAIFRRLDLRMNQIKISA